MKKKDLAVYGVILALAVLLLWQWLSKSSIEAQAYQLQNYNTQLQILAGIGHLHSAHLHADIKVYINGKAIDFSQPRYQLQSSFVHFEDRLGDVFHIHASGLTVGQMLKSVEIDFNSNCLVVESQSYCNEKDKKLKFYVNGQPSSEFGDRVIGDIDKYLVSYGNENDAEIQKQLSSVTSLAVKYSTKR